MALRLSPIKTTSNLAQSGTKPPPPRSQSADGAKPEGIPVYAQPNKPRKESVQSLPDEQAMPTYAQVNKTPRSEKPRPQHVQSPHAPQQPATHVQSRQQAPHTHHGTSYPPKNVDWYESVDVSTLPSSIPTSHRPGQPANARPSQPPQSLHLGRAEEVRTVGQTTTMPNGVLNNQRATSPPTPGRAAPASSPPGKSPRPPPPPPQRKDSLLPEFTQQHLIQAASVKTVTPQGQEQVSPTSTSASAIHSQEQRKTSPTGQQPPHQGPRLWKPPVQSRASPSPGPRPPFPHHPVTRPLHYPHVPRPLTQNSGPRPQTQTNPHHTPFQQNSAVVQRPPQQPVANPVRPPMLDLQRVQNIPTHQSPSSGEERKSAGSPTKDWPNNRPSAQARSPPNFSRPNHVEIPASQSVPGSAPLSAGYNTKRPEDGYRPPNAPKGGSHFSFNPTPRPNSPTASGPVFDSPLASDPYLRRPTGISVSQPVSGTTTPRNMYGQPQPYRGAPNGMHPATGHRTFGQPANSHGMVLPHQAGQVGQQSATPTPYYNRSNGPSSAGVQRSVSLKEPISPQRFQRYPPQQQPQPTPAPTAASTTVDSAI